MPISLLGRCWFEGYGVNAFKSWTLHTPEEDATYYNVEDIAQTSGNGACSRRVLYSPYNVHMPKLSEWSEGMYMNVWGICDSSVPR